MLNNGGLRLDLNLLKLSLNLCDFWNLDLCRNLLLLSHGLILGFRLLRARSLIDSGIDSLSQQLIGFLFFLDHGLCLRDLLL